MSKAFEPTECPNPDIVAQCIGRQCDLPELPEAGTTKGGGIGQYDPDGNWSTMSLQNGVRCLRTGRWTNRRKASKPSWRRKDAVFTTSKTEWSIGGYPVHDDVGVRVEGALVRILVETAPDGHGVEVRLFQRGKRARRLPLVDGRLSVADAEAMKLRFDAERVMAALA
jgi:hypothetical protein